MTAVPIPAATLILFREAAAGPPQILMVERAAAMAFAPGAMVFPGGRIDPGDHALADTQGESDDAPARIAAIRETIEEAGVAIGLSPSPDAATIGQLRAALHAGRPFAGALAAAGLTLDLPALTPFARWRPNHRTTRLFDTLFLLARAPQFAQAQVDGTENRRLTWTTAAAMLAAADAGRATIIYPTRRTLERLARFATYEEAVADAAAHPIRAITPFIASRDGVAHLCIPDDLGFPVTAEPLDQASRG